METLKNILSNLGMPRAFHVSYIVEVLILAVLIYELLMWVKNTRAWTLLKGIIVIIVFVAFSYIFNLTTITWLISKTAGVFVIMLVILFQPELRRALEQLGRRNFLGAFFRTEGRHHGGENGLSHEKANDEIIRAVYEMSKKKTGALIVIEQQVLLSEYERTGIILDAFISSQLLINIFEKNTPLHDGAVFIQDERIRAATCYLPLSDNMNVGKELGTRHRAGLGVSEVSDSITIIVSEETGDVSIAEGGYLTRNVKKDYLRKKLTVADNSSETKLGKLKGMIRNGIKQADR